MSADTHQGGSARLATFFVTSRCNLSCPYCYAVENRIPPGATWEPRTVDGLLDLLAARGYRIALGGGEPLLEAPLVLDIARRARRRSMGVSLLTNGILLDEAILAELVAAGVGWIQISADRLRELERISGVLAAGLALGARLAIGTVLLPDAAGEIPEMLRRMDELGLTGWRILRLSPLGRASALAAPANRAWIEMLLAVEEAVRSLSPGLQIRYEPSVVPWAWIASRGPGERLDVCGGRSGRRLFLYPDGEIHRCGLPRKIGIPAASFRDDPLGCGPAIDRVEPGPPFPGESAYCRDVCRGGCLQQRGETPCDPRCEISRGLVPVCSFEKLLLSPGRHAPGEPTWPSELYRDVTGRAPCPR